MCTLTAVCNQPRWLRINEIAFRLEEGESYGGLALEAAILLEQIKQLSSTRARRREAADMADYLLQQGAFRSPACLLNLIAQKGHIAGRIIMLNKNTDSLGLL